MNLYILKQFLRNEIGFPVSTTLGIEKRRDARRKLLTRQALCSLPSFFFFFRYNLHSINYADICCVVFILGQGLTVETKLALKLLPASVSVELGLKACAIYPSLLAETVQS